MPAVWYEKIEMTEDITQGDLISDCPVLSWSNEQSTSDGEYSTEQLEGMAHGETCNVIIMSQACDLNQDKISNVVLCPYYFLDEFRELWTVKRRQVGRSANSDAWKSFCESVKKGFIWNLVLLDKWVNQDGESIIPHCIVDFTEIYTVPKSFIDFILQHQSRPRLRLLPPYREHLSQAFARFFMRVGLPEDIVLPWQRDRASA